MKADRNRDSVGPQLTGKVDGLVTHCLYMIATGKWVPGAKLPSIRQGETMWDLNRLTVQKAYHRLEALGLIRSQHKSGYYVDHDAGVKRLSRHRYALENFYDALVTRIRDDLELSPLGVFRYMARMAEIVSAEHPECAFVECTQSQAEGHAREIMDRLRIPVMAFSTSAIAGKRSRLPGHIRTVFVSFFHLAELREIDNAEDLHIVAVPIEVSPELKLRVSQKNRRAVLLEIEDVQASHIRRDSKSILSDLELDTRVVEAIEPTLEQIYSENPDNLVLLSPRVWGVISEHWRKHPGVQPVTFRICESAWQSIADAAGMPLGEY